MAKQWVATASITGAIFFVFIFLQTILKIDLSWQVGTVDPRFLISTLAHANIGHLLGNAFGLALFGLILEHTIPRKNYLLLIILSAITGQIAGIGYYDRVIGISAVVFGIIGSLAVLRPTMIVWVAGMPMPMLLAGILWGAYSIIGSLANTQTGHLAHLGGLVVGVVLGLLWRKQYGVKKKKRPPPDPSIDNALDHWESRFMSASRRRPRRPLIIRNTMSKRPIMTVMTAPTTLGPSSF